jgi:hypothetical protein
MSDEKKDELPPFVQNDDSANMIGIHLRAAEPIPLSLPEAASSFRRRSRFTIPPRLYRPAFKVSAALEQMQAFCRRG